MYRPDTGELLQLYLCDIFSVEYHDYTPVPYYNTCMLLITWFNSRFWIKDAQEMQVDYFVTLRFTYFFILASQGSEFLNCNKISHKYQIVRLVKLGNTFGKRYVKKIKINRIQKIIIAGNAVYFK